MELTIPGFDLVVPIQVPVWTGVDNIFSFAQEYLLYFHLHEKLDFHFDNWSHSGIFFWAIQFSEFADTVTVLQTQMNSFRFEYDKSYLPPHLCLHGLATSIHQNLQAHLKDITMSCAHQIKGNLSQIQGLPVVHRISQEDRLCSGYCNKPGAHGDGQFCDSGDDLSDGRDPNGGRGNNGRAYN
jgi:hypothetical protein